MGRVLAARSLKPLAALLIVLPTAAGPAAGAAAPRKAPRVVRVPYSPNPHETITLNHLDPGVSVTSVDLQARPGEDHVMVKLTDDSAEIVRGNVYQRNVTHAPFCDETEEPVAVDPTQEIQIIVYEGPCDGRLSLPTQGMVEVTFLRG